MGDVVRVIREENWSVGRTAVMEEVQLDNGAVRFRVSINDEGRPPFLTRWFNDLVPAADFIEKVQGGRFIATNDRK